MIDDPNSLYVCMGSACHQLGVFHLLPKLQALLDKHNLAGRIKVKGAFCVGPCMQGVVLKFRDVQYLSYNASNAEEKFERELLPVMTGQAPAELSAATESAAGEPAQ